MSDRVDDIIQQWRQRRPDLDTSALEVVSRVLRAAHYLQARLDDIATAYGLSHTGDLEVLSDLYRIGPPHEMTPTRLADALLLTTGGMTARLNRLQEAGLVERHPDPHDRRGVLVRLTPNGAELAEHAITTLLEAQADSLRALDTAQRKDLGRLLRTLLEALGDTPAFRPTITAERGRPHRDSDQPSPRPAPIDQEAQ